MRLNRLALVLAASVALAGCEKPVKIDERRTTVEVVSVYLTSKSNSKVTLRETRSGYVWREQYLSCYRHEARKIRIGGKWDVVEQTFVYPESQRYFSRLVGTPAICTKSQ